MSVSLNAGRDLFSRDRMDGNGDRFLSTLSFAFWGSEMGHDTHDLEARYGRPRYVHEQLSAGGFGPLDSPRMAEVAMVIVRKNGMILLNTKSFYPEGAYRLPTGGVKPGEDVVGALLRETAEETSLEVEVSRFLAVVTYQAPGRQDPFKTYAFLLREVGGTLKVNDLDERISGWREVSGPDLKEVAATLAGLGGGWSGWGRFRSVVHRVVCEVLGET